MKDKLNMDKNINKPQEEKFFVSEFDALGGYTGNNFLTGYQPEQDADDM